MRRKPRCWFQCHCRWDNELFSRIYSWSCNLHPAEMIKATKELIMQSWAEWTLSVDWIQSPGVKINCDTRWPTNQSNGHHCLQIVPWNMLIVHNKTQDFDSHNHSLLSKSVARSSQSSVWQGCYFERRATVRCIWGLLFCELVVRMFWGSWLQTMNNLSLCLET